jgi:hypothetical protein
MNRTSAPRKWTGHMRPWFRRPLICLLGVHDWIRHPSLAHVRYCGDCGLEVIR